MLAHEIYHYYHDQDMKFATFFFLIYIDPKKI